MGRRRIAGGTADHRVVGSIVVRTLLRLRGLVCEFYGSEELLVGAVKRTGQVERS